jgi:hypothetical protein
MKPDCYTIEFDSAGQLHRLSDPALPGAEVGMGWGDFIGHTADESVRGCLYDLWKAVAQGQVASGYWPDTLPFRDGFVARLRPTDSDFVLHLIQVETWFRLRHLLETAASPSDIHLIRLAQHVYSGIDGPLTDSQVWDMGEVLHHAEYLHLLLEQTMYQLPGMTNAPLAQPLRDLLTFKDQDFTERRLNTHLIKIRSQWSDAVVYCLPDLRRVVLRALRILLASVSAESMIALSDRVMEDAVRVEIIFHSPDPEFRVLTRLEPMIEAAPTLVIERIIASLQACLNPIHGRAWAEPVQTHEATARIVLLLPRWR